MKFNFKKSLFLIVSSIIAAQSFAQETNKNIRVGFDFLIGSQQVFPFNDLNYNHTQVGYRLQFNYLFRSGKFSYELQIEPSIYIAEHQLMNPYFIMPSDGPDYLQQREYYMQKRTIKDYALNIGIVSRYNFNSIWSIYLIISTGPTYLDSGTERQAKGFAFSNLISAGGAYTTGRLRFEIGPGVRHVSNANTQHPNGGHNSSTLDAGITWAFGK
jgi:Lipid A 3-O-deacylase (PagL)